MRKSKFTDSQIMAMLKQNENGIAVADLCRPLPRAWPKPSAVLQMALKVWRHGYLND